MFALRLSLDFCCGRQSSSRIYKDTYSPTKDTEYLSASVAVASLVLRLFCCYLYDCKYHTA